MKPIFKNKLVIGLFFLICLVLIYIFSLRQDNSVVALSSDKKESIDNKKTLFKYVEIIDSCDYSFIGECVNVRAGAGINYNVIMKLRNGIVLKVDGKENVNGEDWYKISFDEWLRYPERVENGWYISAKYVKEFENEGIILWDNQSTSTKNIIVDRSEQMLYAYDGDYLFMKTAISTGLEDTPTPRGIFHIYEKTPSRFMQGPIPGISENEYNLPGVPWNLYFTNEGAVIHGAYWHNDFGEQHSNGCVNLPLEKAKELYKWADIGTEVLVRD